MVIMEWISVNDRLPEITNIATSDDVLFVCDGKVYFGYYHSNGCFYSSKKAAYTPKALLKYSRHELPASVATWWAPLPLPPVGI